MVETNGIMKKFLPWDSSVSNPLIEGVILSPFRGVDSLNNLFSFC